MKRIWTESDLFAAINFAAMAGTDCTNLVLYVALCVARDQKIKLPKLP